MTHDLDDHEQMKRAMEEMRPNPNPRIVALLDYALNEISAKLRKAEYTKWFGWAESWKSGQRAPQACVNIAHFCFEHKAWGIDGKATDPVWHCLGQLAWAGKEACYSTPTSGWLVVRYIADAMTAFGIAFPEEKFAALEPPTTPDARLYVGRSSRMVARLRLR
jgi:hypothetical protein